MNISRRSFIFGAVASTVYTSLWSINIAKAKISAGSNKEDKDLLIKMVRTLYPHDRFPEGPYVRTTEDVIKKGNSSPEKAIMLQQGIDKLKNANFAKLNFEKSTKFLTNMGRSEFFEHVRGTSTVTLYNDKEVWELLGYEGYSSDQGGYINRGFNDLDWLPEPRIEEHPDHANFFTATQKKLAAVNQKNVNQ